MLQARGISLHFGDHTIFDEVQLTIKANEKIGLIGRNGAGKTTLLKLLSGQMKPDAGVIESAGSFTIGYLPQHINIRDTSSPFMQCRKAIPLLDELTSRIGELETALTEHEDEEILMAHSGELADLHEQMRLHDLQNWEERVERVLTGLGFTAATMQQSTDTLSGGWKMRVELAKLLLQAPDLLMLDEPTNHLDIHAIIWLENFLKQYPGSVILISHDKVFLDEVTHRTILVENGRLVDYPFSYTRALEEKEKQAEIQAATYAMQQKEIAHKERLIDKFRAKNTKAKFAKSLQKELDRMEKVDAPDEESSSMRIRFPQGGREGAVVAKFERAAKAFGDNTVIAGLDLEIERGERIGIVGQNGQGKTTLIKLITKEEPLTNGQLTLGHNIELAYYPQNAAERLDTSKTVLQSMEEVSPEDMRTRLRGILGAFLFQNDDVDKKVSVLSGGEKSRLALARLLLRPSNVLILDEPTHHLDIPSKAILKQALEQYGGTLIIVSHDRDFLSGSVERILAFREGSVKKFLGGIEEYLTSTALEDMREVEMQRKQSAARIAESPVVPSGRELTFEEKKQLKREIQQAERRVERLEKEKKELEQRMMATDFYQQVDHSKVLEKYDECKKSLEEAEADWMERVADLDERD